MGGHLRGGGEEVRDVLLSGAVVGVMLCDMDKNPSVVHSQFSFLEKDAHPEMAKTRSCKRTESFGVRDH
jgi:hypothetical protein